MFQFALFLALFVVAAVFAAEPEAKKDLKGAEQVFLPYGSWGYGGYPYAAYAGYAGYAAYPGAYGFVYRWVPNSAVALRRTDDDTARPID